MKASTLITLVIALVALIFAGFAYLNTDEYPQGASSGPDHYNMEYFYAGLVQGGSVTALTGTSTTITATQACDSAIITFASVATIGSDIASTTLPTAASMSRCLMKNQDSKTFLFRNINTNSASSTVIKVSSTSVETLLISTSSASATILGGQSALITIIRNSSTTVIDLIQGVFKDGD